MRKLLLSLVVLALVAADVSACHRGRLRERRAERRGGSCESAQVATFAVAQVGGCAPAATVTASATVQSAGPRLMPQPQQVPAPMPPQP